MKLAGLHLWQQNYPQALKTYRRAAHIEELEFARKQGRGDVAQGGHGRNSVFAGLAITVWHVLRNEAMRKKLGEDQCGLMDEALYAGQRALAHISRGRAGADVGAFCSWQRRLAEAVRQRQDLTRRYDRFDKKLCNSLGAPPKSRDENSISWGRLAVARVGALIKQLDKKLAKQFPEYATLANPQPLKTTEIQAQLKSDEALLYFMTSNQAVYIWALTDKHLSWTRAPLKRTKLRTQIAELRKALDPTSAGTRGFAPDEVDDLASSNAPGPVVTSFDLKASWQLYKDLLQPLEGTIKDKKHLLIVASDSLTALPFQVLANGAPANQRGR